MIQYQQVGPSERKDVHTSTETEKEQKTQRVWRTEDDRRSSLVARRLHLATMHRTRLAARVRGAHLTKYHSFAARITSRHEGEMSLS